MRYVAAFRTLVLDGVNVEISARSESDLLAARVIWCLGCVVSWMLGLAMIIGVTGGLFKLVTK